MKIINNKIIFAGMMLLAVSLLHATTIKRMNILDLVQRAEHIFAGRVVGVEEGKVAAPDGSEILCTIYTLTIMDAIKGHSSPTIKIRFLGSQRMAVQGRYGRKLDIPGMPNYKLDDEVLIFLNKQSPIELTVPVGLSQGSFNIYSDPRTGKKMVVNGIDNAGLFNGVAESALQTIKSFTPDERVILKQQRGAFGYESFVGLLRKLQ